MATIARRLRTAAWLGAALMLGSGAAGAQTATGLACDRCVDKGDIADKAVTAVKIRRDSIYSSKIVNRSIRSVDIGLGEVGADEIADGAVTGAELANGAVTAAKLAEDAVFGQIRVVANDPMDQAGNCDALRATLADITDNAADNPYTVMLEPGVYDCGSDQVVMKPYIDIQGSGRSTTSIRSDFISPGQDSGAIMGADDAELRSLTVESHAATLEGFAVLVYTNGSSVRIANVDIIATGANANRNLIADGGGSPRLTDVFISATGVAGGGNQFPLVCDGSGVALTLVNVTSVAAAAVSAGLTVSTGTTCVVTARNSVIKGDQLSVQFNGGTANLATTQLDGPVEGAASRNCVDAYDGNFEPLGGDCNAIP